MVNITNAPSQSTTPSSSLLPSTLLGFQHDSTQYAYASPSGTTNDVNGGFPRFLGNVRLAVTLAAGSATWTGLGAGNDGQHLILWNTDAANTLTLLVSNAGSVVGNRFSGPAANYVLSAGNACELVYYAGTINAWVIAAGIGASGGGGGGGTGAVISLTITAASTNNLDPGSGFPTGVGRLDINPSTNDIAITGLLAGTDGQQLIVRNVGTGGFLITLKVNSGLSSPANIFTGEGDAGIPQGAQTIIFYYTSPTAGWAVG